MSKVTSLLLPSTEADMGLSNEGQVVSRKLGSYSALTFLVLCRSGNNIQAIKVAVRALRLLATNPM